MDDSTNPALPVAEIRLPGEARSAGRARRFLADALTGWDRSDYADDAALLLTELVTNAALHAKTEIIVSVRLSAASLWLAVTDASPRQPVVRHYRLQSTTGRGLALVSEVASNWGIHSNADGTKTVWAELRGRAGGSQGAPESTVEVGWFFDPGGSAPAVGRTETTYLPMA